MRVRLCSFWLPKEGNHADEYEDAFWPARSGSFTARAVRCAVADGATETSFSGQWARQLVQAFGRGRIRTQRLREALVPLRASWWESVRQNPLPWYAEEKLRSGAFASLLGVTLTSEPDSMGVRWTAMAVGDTCLFVVSEGALNVSFPLESSQDFDRSPHLISSLSGRPGEAETMPRWNTGMCQPHNTLYLLTDALACWFLTTYEHGGQPWSTLDTFDGEESHARFADWIAIERRARHIRNDDITMLRMRLE